MTHKMEAHIIINGVPLTFAQSMTVRVAMSAYADDLKNNGLGDDNVGKSIVSNYLKNIKEINTLIFKNM